MKDTEKTENDVANVEKNATSNETAKDTPRIVTRRGFLTGAAGLAAGAALAPALSSRAFGPFIARAAEPGHQKLKLLHVATGGQAGSHHVFSDPANESVGGNECLAYCDVDPTRYGSLVEKAPNAKQYTDWRKMFDAHLDNADAVIVATPDHSHALPSLHAILAGKHVYCEKPLTWSIEEARAMQDATLLKKVATQMGNQGHANEGNRLTVEWINAGLIGDVVEIHTWTNRPIWPQGNLAIEEVPKPDQLNWDVWLGPAAERPFHTHLHPFEWRGWKDFGCGAVGDMGCHTWDAPYWSTLPDYPSQVELLEVVEPGPHTFAKQTHFKWTFPAKGDRPGFVAHWYSGGLRPPVPDEIKNDEDRPADKRDLPGTGSLYVGTKGKLLVAGDYGDSPRLIPEKFMREANRPEKTIPRSPGHKEEWIMAARGEQPWTFPKSNFANYAAPLTEVMLLGSIAEKIAEPGFVIECDPVKREILTPRAKEYRNRAYRKGFELPKVS